MVVAEVEALQMIGGEMSAHACLPTKHKEEEEEEEILPSTTTSRIVVVTVIKR